MCLEELKVVDPDGSKIYSIQFERKEIKEVINELTNVDHDVLNNFIYQSTKLASWIKAFTSLIMLELDREIEPKFLKLEVQSEHM